MIETWFVLASGLQPPAYNMALDEAILEFVSTLGQPVLRFYGWTVPAATFGYSQHYRDVEAWTSLRPLIRRPTGGGLVPHDADWTYSLSFPPSHSWYHLKAVDSYRQAHEWISRAFTRLDIPTELAAAEQKLAPGQCFLGAEKFDLLRNGVKIAGAAQRRTRSGLLIQGSIQPRTSQRPRADWERAMMETAIPCQPTSWKPLAIDGLLAEKTSQLVSEKYAQSSYNQRR